MFSKDNLKVRHLHGSVFLNRILTKLQIFWIFQANVSIDLDLEISANAIGMLAS